MPMTRSSARSMCLCVWRGAAGRQQLGNAGLASPAYHSGIHFTTNSSSCCCCGCFYFCCFCCFPLYIFHHTFHFCAWPRVACECVAFALRYVVRLYKKRLCQPTSPTHKFSCVPSFKTKRQASGQNQPFLERDCVCPFHCVCVCVICCVDMMLAVCIAGWTFGTLICSVCY